MERPLFSVLIANYNNGKFLEAAISSVLSQTYTHFEVIIVDDASIDGSQELIRELVKKDSRLRFFENQQNSGCGYTKRRCVEFASGDVCGFLDPDDELVNNALEITVDQHLEHVDASIVFSNYYHCDEKMNVISVRKPKVSHGIVTTSQLNRQLINHFVTFKRSMYNKSVGINPVFHRAVDQDLYLKLEEQGQVVYVDKNLYCYRYHSNGISAFDNNFKALYWFMKAKQDACLRRKIDEENFMANEYSLLQNFYKSTLAFKLGNGILIPVRIARTLLLRLFWKNRG